MTPLQKRKVSEVLGKLARSNCKQDGYLSKLIRAAHDNAGAISSEMMNIEGLRLQTWRMSVR